jgi:hexosaminidase
MVDSFLGDAPHFLAGREALLAIFASWQSAPAAAGALVDRSPALAADARPYLDHLARLGATGAEAVTRLAQLDAASADWQKQRLGELSDAVKPRAYVQFAVVQPLRQLAIAAARVAELRNTSPADWKRQIDQQAKPPATPQTNG